MAKVHLARDRAKVLALMEEVAVINEGIDEGNVDEHLRVSLELNNLMDDPRMAPLAQALSRRDRGQVADSLETIAAAAGLTRIGGDPRHGAEQPMSFDRTRHANMAGEPLSTGRKVWLLRPGYSLNIDGEDLVLERAAVIEATPEEIRRLSKP